MGGKSLKKAPVIASDRLIPKTDRSPRHHGRCADGLTELAPSGITLSNQNQTPTDIAEDRLPLALCWVIWMVAAFLMWIIIVELIFG